MTAIASKWRDPVPPIAATSEPRPRWSVMIPTYRCSGYLARALESVLAQDPGPAAMQIEVVDDASDDDPELVVREVGRGRVGFFRQPRNVGHITNFHSCVLRSRGEIVHLLHGDDFVRPGFYSALLEGFDAVPGLGAAFCRASYAAADGTESGTTPEEAPRPGLLEDAVVRLAREQRVMTPAIAVRRAVYEALGGFDRRLSYAEDWEMWVRIAANFPIWYEPRPLAVYRMHASSNSGRHVRSAADAADNRAAIRIFREYLPRERAAAIARDARRTYAASALETARELLQGGDHAGFLAQVREAFLLSPSRTVIRRALAIALASRKKRALPQ